MIYSALSPSPPREKPTLHSTESVYDVVGRYPSPCDANGLRACKQLSASSPSLWRPVNTYSQASDHIYAEPETTKHLARKSQEEDDYMELNQMYSISLPDILHAISIESTAVY